jgi:hypothetical protein
VLYQHATGVEPRKDERRRRPQFLAALVQHLLLGPACFHWSDERVLDLFLYRAQPLLSACRAALKTLNLAFQFPDPIFGKVGAEWPYLCHCGRGTEGPGYGRRLWAARRRSNRRQDVPTGLFL